MGRSQLTGSNVKDESLTGDDVQDGSIHLVDLNQEVINAINNGSGVPYTQVGHGFAVLDVVRISSGSWVKAKANTEDTLGLGVVVAVSDADNFEVSMHGRFQIPSHGLTVEEYYFLSDTTAGGLISTAPAVNQPIVYVEDANYIWILPYRPGTTSDPNLHQPIWKDLLAPLNTAKSNGATTPTWSEIGSTGFWAWHFDQSLTNELQVVFHLEHDYYLGSSIFPHIHWCPVDGNTGVVRWVMEISYAKGHQQAAFNFSNPIQLVIESSANGTQWEHIVGEGEVTDQTMTNALEPDSMVIIRVYRDGAHVNDTYPSDAIGLQVDIHYQADRIGTPNKAPNFYA